MAVFYAAFFAFGGIQMPYLPAWLSSRGLDAREIGILLAAPMVVRIVIVPLVTRLVDRRFDVLRALTIAASLAAAGYAVMAGARGFVAIFAAYVAISIVAAPVLPLGDAYGLRGLNARGLAYGPVRLWGSVAFIFANMAGGMFLERFGAAPIAFALAGATALTAAATLLLPRASETAAAAKVSAGPTGSLWKSGLFVAVALGASLVQASHAVLYGFVTLQWTAAGLDGTTIGLLWAIGVVAEILLFAVSGRLIMRIGAIETILLARLAACCGGLRWRSIRPRRCCRRCNAFTRCRSARRMWARCMCWLASPVAAPPPRATSPRCRASPLPPQWRCPVNWWRNSQASPISPWRQSRRPAFSSRLAGGVRGTPRRFAHDWAVVALIVETRVCARSRGYRGRRATLHHGREFLSAQHDHVRRETAAAIDPFAHVLRIDVVHGARRLAGLDFGAGAIRAPCGVKSEHGLWRDADLVARQDPDRERAGRVARAVDDDLFAADARLQEPRRIGDEEAAAIAGDAHGRAGGRRRNHDRRGNACEHQRGAAHVSFSINPRK
jgi:PPP family 3-phenylpropionic acid transporter